MHTPAFPQVVVTALGDSLTAGWGLSSGEAWPEVAEAMLRKKGLSVQIINAGVSGDTSAGGLARAGWTLRDDPDILVLALGANDALRGLSPELMRDNLAEIIERARAQGAEVLLAGMRAPANLGQGYAERFANVFDSLAEEYDVAFLPFLLQGVAGVDSLNLPDGIHPNEHGARRIAENLVPLLEKMIRQVGKQENGESE